ncbi:hypothetical protein ACFVAV_06875 [Nocardia sp. NPDC057663]|uniref:hypothetical protein n=1 Tax=Nocardia sp. NPDC057663 TaxID=3346201 RepID=UPI0036725EBE
MERKIHSLPKLLSLAGQTPRAFRLVAVDDVTEGKAEAVDEIAIATKLGTILEGADNRIRLSERIAVVDHDLR